MGHRIGASAIGVLRHAHASHAIDNGAPLTLVSATLGARGPENHQRLCTCQTWRKQRPVFEDELRVVANLHQGSEQKTTAAQQFRLLYEGLLPWRHAGLHACS
jgi:hypothetical protein